MPGPPIGPPFRSTSTRRLIDVEVGIVDSGGEVVDVLEDDRASSVPEQVGLGGAALDDGAVGAQVAAEHDERAAFANGCVERRITSASGISAPGEVLAAPSGR